MDYLRYEISLYLSNPHLLIVVLQNIDLARNELQDARDEQMKLLRLRERLLGRMAESVT
jgi:hypothetical protein